MSQDPATLRRQLLKELRRYRSDAGLTQKDVANAMDWSASKVIRIESGSVTISTNDLRALLSYYGVKDTDVVAELVQMAKDSRRQSFGDYRPHLSQTLVQYYGYEASAWIIRQFEPLVVPGLLQTEEYTRAVLLGHGHSAEDLEIRVQARAERQQVLDREQPPQLFFVMDEAVLRREIGGPRVMARQRAYLRELNERPQITIQIVPFSHGAYPGTAGPFVLLEFPGTEGDTVLYLEGRDDYVTRDDPDQIGKYLDIFQRMEREYASNPDQLAAFLTSAVQSGGGDEPA
jgi:transcriptional regulator with XRE-family HTH domain